MSSAEKIHTHLINVLYAIFCPLTREYTFFLCSESTLCCKTGGNLVWLMTPHRRCKFLNIFSWNRHNSMADTRRGGWLLVSPMNIIGGILTLVTLNERLRSKSWKVLWCTFRFPWFIIGTTTRTKSGHKLCKKRGTKLTLDYCLISWPTYNRDMYFFW